MFPRFSFRITDGEKVSDVIVFNHYAWDGRRAFAHVVKYPPPLQSHHRVSHVDFLRGSSFKESAIEYLMDRQFDTPVFVSVVISKRDLYDSDTFGNFIVTETFEFDPSRTFVENKEALADCIRGARQSSVQKTVPWRIMWRISQSRVVLNAWTLPSDVLSLFPEVTRDPVNKHDKTFVVLSNVYNTKSRNKEWYVREEIKT
jgi:hypothetical protein